MTPRRPTAPSGSRGAPRPRQPVGARPAPRPRSAPAGQPRSAPRPRPAPARARPAFGRPITVVAGVAVVLAVLITPYLRSWFQQRSELAGLHEQVAQSRQDVADLQQERQRWNDPAHVKTQARERLNFVLPGETGFVLLGDDLEAGGSDPRPGSAREQGAQRAWFGELWQSVRVAGEPSG